MSDHNHSHSGPNAHNHSHGPPQQTPQQMPIPPPPDPVLQAALDARIQSVQLKLVPPADPTKGVFQVESKDPKFQYDWEAFNSLALQLATALPPPHESIPPPINPATVLQNPRSHAVVKAKDEGNVRIYLLYISHVLTLIRNSMANTNTTTQSKCTALPHKSLSPDQTGKPPT